MVEPFFMRLTYACESFSPFEEVESKTTRTASKAARWLMKSMTLSSSK